MDVDADAEWDADDADADADDADMDVSTLPSGAPEPDAGSSVVTGMATGMCPSASSGIACLPRTLL